MARTRLTKAETELAVVAVLLAGLVEVGKKLPKIESWMIVAFGVLCLIGWGLYIWHKMYMEEKLRPKCLETVMSHYHPRINPYEYEHLIANAMRAMNWKATVTQGSGDGGVDVIAKKNGKTLVIQCKKYSNNVGYDAVKEAFTGRAYYNADFAAVVTNSAYTRAAIEKGGKLGVQLITHENLGLLNNLA